MSPSSHHQHHRSGRRAYTAEGLTVIPTQAALQHHGPPEEQGPSWHPSMGPRPDITTGAGGRWGRDHDDARPDLPATASRWPDGPQAG